MSDIVKYSLWTDCELTEALKALETAKLTGATQVTFLGQTVIYKNNTALNATIDELTKVLCDRGVLPDSAVRTKTKRVLIQTRDSGFCS